MNALTLLSAWEGATWFAELSDEGRRGVRERGAAIERYLKAPWKSRGRVNLEEAARLGMKPSTFRAWVTKFRRGGGDPRQLIDFRREPHADAIMPPEFLDFWKNLQEENQRCSRPAWRKLRDLYLSRATEYQWKKTSDVVALWPGYAERPEPSPSSNDGMPRGWSYSNLTRRENSCTALELAAARQGPIAASALQEQIFTTRVGLKPGQFYVFDDRWLDGKGVLPGVTKKPVRMVELSCGDIFSGHSVAWGLLPMIDDDEGRQQRLKDRDMRALLAQVICLIGFHEEGVTLKVEHGTAAISRELELLLCVLSGGTVQNGEIVEPGLIRVDRSGIQGGKTFAGGFPTLGKGNFRFKAAWESLHNLKHNELADQAGQVGKNSRLETVEDDHGRDAEACFILTACVELDPQIATNLVTGYMPVSDWFRANAAVIRRIENYTDHRLQGWKEAGLVTADYRLDHAATWQPMAKLLTYGDVQRAAIEAALENDLHLTRTRQLSRAEAWQRGVDKLTTLPPHCVPAILGRDLSEEKTVLDKNGGSFEFTKAGEDAVMYRALVRRDDGTGERLAAGMTYRVWQLSHEGRSYLFVQHLSGKFLGVCEEIPRIEHGNQDAFLRQAAEASRMHADALAPFYRRAVKRNRAETRRRQMNVAQLEVGAPAAAIDDYELPDYGSMTQ